jgi:hypothetical protein
MKLKATIKYDSKYKLLAHTTKCPFSRNRIRSCFQLKYDFVIPRSSRYVQINRTALRKISRCAIVRLVNPAPLLEVRSPFWGEQDQRFDEWDHQNCKVLNQTQFWLHARDLIPVSYKLYFSYLNSFLHSLHAIETFCEFRHQQ